ncbi:ATP-binding protein [Rhodoferax sp.]|uniref:ATP-binding protein n=1 Tax=Rhodoferax sp. TaxID=50421 RepID=UPI00345BE0C7
MIGNEFKCAGDATLVVQQSNEFLRIGVRDHGPGVPTSELNQVTQAYYRVHKARTGPGMGVGLGLAIVSEVALAHGGRLALKNHAQGGLIALLILPHQPSGIVPIPQPRPHRVII